MVGFTKNNELNPDEFKLEQNYPNPFNPTTTIQFSIPPSKGGRGDDNGGTTLQSVTKLVIYNSLGREVKTLVNEKLQAGNYKIAFNASALPSGIYFYTLTKGTFKASKNMVLIK
jgi:hypothetical protein